MTRAAGSHGNQLRSEKGRNEALGFWLPKEQVRQKPAHVLLLKPNLPGSQASLHPLPVQISPSIL